MARKRPSKPKKAPAARKRSAVRAPERDYSHRTLIDKLGVKADQVVAVIGVGDAGFLDELSARVPGFSTGWPEDAADLIFFAAEDRSDLTEVKNLAHAITKAGAIWIVYPKGQAHIREADVRTVGLAAGLTDNKVCRFSETHTALRFCIPVAKR